VSCSQLIGLQGPVFQHCIPIKILYATLISMICAVYTVRHSVNGTGRSPCMQFQSVWLSFNMTWKFTPHFKLTR
jgi:hypothetical protein